MGSGDKQGKRNNMGNGVVANGKKPPGWIARYGVVGGLVLIGIGTLVISGFAKKVYHAAEAMPMIEYRLTQDSLVDVEQDQRLEEIEETLKEIKYMVCDLWKNQVPHYQREETELILRGGGEKTD